MLPKPNLLFFQFKYDERVPEFLLIHKREHVKCLSIFFNVTVINEDCDYQQLCEEYRPDIALFESGVNHGTCRRLNIKNTRSHPNVPKVGLHHGDGFCNARAGFLSDMENWGIDTFFSISVTAGEHTPCIRDNLFVWPVFIDSDVFKDYQSAKNIPVLFTGNTNQFYPWRTKIIKRVSNHYPSLICPHPGYASRATTGRLMVGAEYSRLINASWFVPACGTVAKEVVRKHFEIPGSRACLVTQESPGLKAAGFVDMTNCVFVDEHDVIDKLELLFKNPEMLDGIIGAGYQLVHSRHTMAHRNQIFEWLMLRKHLKAGQKIVQLNPFSGLSVVDENSGTKSSHIISNGLHLSLRQRGDESLLAGNYQKAESHYLKSLNYMRWMPELKLRLALCNLYMGNPKVAAEWLDEPIHFILCSYKAVDPDPVEWAYFILCLLCLGRREFAVEKSREFPWLRHPELDRTRWAIGVIQQKSLDAPLPGDGATRNRSIHQLPTRSLGEWVKEVCLMLRACKQAALAELLEQGASTRDKNSNREFFSERTESQYERRHGSTKRYFQRRILLRKWGGGVRSSVAFFLHRLESKYGYFLPHRISESRNDEFFKDVHDLARDENIRTALIVGAARNERSTQAFLAGILENPNEARAYCVNIADQLEPAHMREPINSRVRWFDSSNTELKKTVEKIAQEEAIESFDLVLIDGSEVDRIEMRGLSMKELEGTKAIILDDTDRLSVHKRYDRLSSDSRYFLAACSPTLRSGYAIFKRI